MRCIFMGTPAYAVPALKLLHEKAELCAVFSRPDAISKRGSKLIPSPVSACATELGIPLFTPKSLRNAEVIAEIRDFNPDLIVVAAYGMILPKEVLEIPRYGCVNLHASLLPRWRGAAPIQRAILAGDDETGVALMNMEEGLDTGAYAFVARTQVGEKSKDELEAELAELGAGLLDQLLASDLETLDWTKQDERLVTYADKISASELLLDPSEPAETFLRKVRASSDSAASYLQLELGGKSLKLRILEAQPYALEGSAYVEAIAAAPSNVFVGKRAFLLKAADEWLEVLRVQAEGKKAMSALDFARGARISSEQSWSKASW